jgi:hypothetical protein
MAYAMGSVIQFKIRRVEPLHEAGTVSGRTARNERLANLALVLEYAISVGLYIYILASFLLGGLGIHTPFRENLLVIVIIVTIGLMGRFKGLDLLLILERWALVITGLLLSLMIGVFAVFDWNAFTTGTLQLPCA